MTELTHYQPQAAVVAYQDDAYARLEGWAHAAQAVAEIAVSIVQTSFCPAQFRGKPEEATAAILSGLEVGLSPMASLKAFDVIQGTAAPKAITHRAIVQSQGHEILLQESTATRCIMAGRRKDSDKWQRSTWTIDRARDLSLLGKDNWKKQPAAMLIARATSEVCRLVASDALLGIPYSSEELADGVTPTTLAAVPNEEPAQPSGVRKMSRPKRGPSEDDIEKQKRRMHALFREVNITDHDGRVAFAEQHVGSPVSSTDELDFSQRAEVITALENVQKFSEMEPPEAAS